MTSILFAIILIAVLSLMLYQLAHVKSTPSPRKAAYLTAYSERVINGIISCGCGSTDIRATGTPSNFDTFIICRCKTCQQLLYTASAGDKKPLEVEAV